MTADDVRARIAELARSGPAPGDDPTAQVEAALFIEMVFGISLTDEDMTVETLGSYPAMERLVLERVGAPFETPAPSGSG